jgi:hypothetical protein
LCHASIGRDPEDGGVEELLSGAAERRGQSAGEHRDDRSSERAGKDPACHPPAATGDRPGHGHDDADNDAGFEHFTKHDDQGCKHVGPR